MRILNYKKNTLFIIAGESNSGGVALNSDALAGESGLRKSVKILNLNTLTSFDNLYIGGAGENNLLDHSGLSASYQTCHGFEMEIANRAADLVRLKYDSPCYVVKTGQGGSVINDWKTDANGWYTKLVNRINACKTLLPFNNLNIVILYSQGINDAIYATNLTTWKSDTIAYLANLRSLFGMGNIPIIMTQFQAMQSGGYSAMDTKIAEVAATVNNCYCVSSAGAGVNGDGNHWNYAGMKLVTGRLLDVWEGLF